MRGERTAGAARGTLGSYLTGFLLAVGLTAVSFILVMTAALPRSATIALIIVLAVAQIGVHLVFFLHLSPASEQRWNLVVFIYTLIILFVLVGASVWIMAHLDRLMVR